MLGALSRHDDYSEAENLADREPKKLHQLQELF